MYWNTVNFRLKDSLDKLMTANELIDFRLVGGTSLSLQLGHRMSDDIDLFADDTLYGTLDFDAIERFLLHTFPYLSGTMGGNPGWGKSYFIGSDKDDNVKLDIMYSSDPFFDPFIIEDNVRMATVDEIIAMKLGIMKVNGRKKDFWDLHELLESYSIDDMIDLWEKRWEWTDDRQLIKSKFTDFAFADTFIDPKCLRGKKWNYIKESFVELIERDRNPGYLR